MAERKSESAARHEVDPQKKEYFAPKVVHTEKLTALATSCALADATCTTGGQTGPLQS